MNSSEIRRAFLEYFQKNGHEIVASSPLVPGNDPTLLFTNAGMVQFKDVFLGHDQRAYSRATTSQRCVRAGGKHNDLENVGYTARHHTFFEMLGNFSFGDYFKREAIQYAWEFLTEVVKLPAEKLWVTVYSEDDEAADIWLKEIGVNSERFTRIGDKPGGKRYESDNFWAMGDTGPCGPCSEIFYDHGPSVAGGPPGTPEEDGDRYIEIWNLVFMQYNRFADGRMDPLPKPSVDTGMGLERLAAVLQHVHSNYEIDLFQNLIAAAAKATGSSDLTASSLRVIADHIRACSFLITDGVLPSNEGRGYVLRRIIRRAIRHGYKLGVTQPFFHTLVSALVAEMGQAYPELAAAQGQVAQVLKLEEERFAETLEQGMRILEQTMGEAKDRTIPGDVAFKLYDTYGFPIDLTGDVARERGMQLDMDGFQRHMEEQRDRARAASRFSVDLTDNLGLTEKTAFVGYDRTQSEAKVSALAVAGGQVDILSAGDEGIVVLNETPFYAESGGQVGDRGMISAGDARFEVRDTQKQASGTVVHIGRLITGSLSKGQSVSAIVNESERRETACNHTATHLLHAALRSVLGKHVQQKGSLVDSDHLRFDFSHFEPMTRAQIEEVESIVNREIRRNAEVSARVMGYDDAIAAGAMALFGEKYGSEVRVLAVGEFSVELCGGTHVSRAGDIGVFRITSETGVAAGVRRIEAVAGLSALRRIHEGEQILERLGQQLKGGRDLLEDKVQGLLEKNRELEKQLARLQGKLASSQGNDLVSGAIDISGIKVVAARLEGADAKVLRETVDQLKQKLKSAVVILAAVEGSKVSLVAGVTEDATAQVKAGALMKHVAEQVGGKGGGRPDMAQGGGSDVGALGAALDGVASWVAGQLGTR